MEYEYWFITLPPKGAPREKNETIEEHANRGLTELVGRGWEPISVTRDTSLSPVGFLLRKRLVEA